MVWVFIACLLLLAILLLPSYFERRKLYALIDPALEASFSHGAITILLARDSTRSLGRALRDREAEKIRGIVTQRATRLRPNAPIGAKNDVADVFRYLKQTSAPFLMQNNERIVAIIPAVGLREPRGANLPQHIRRPELQSDEGCLFSRRHVALHFLLTR